MWKNFDDDRMIELVRTHDDVIIWRVRFSCVIPKAIRIYSEYVTLTAFPLQQLLHKRALMLRYTYIVCLVILQGVPLATEPGIYLIILPLKRILQRNLKRTYLIV